MKDTVLGVPKRQDILKSAPWRQATILISKSIGELFFPRGRFLNRDNNYLSEFSRRSLPRRVFPIQGTLIKVSFPGVTLEPSYLQEGTLEAGYL